MVYDEEKNIHKLAANKQAFLQHGFTWDYPGRPDSEQCRARVEHALETPDKGDTHRTIKENQKLARKLGRRWRRRRRRGGPQKKEARSVRRKAMKNRRLPRSAFVLRRQFPPRRRLTARPQAAVMGNPVWYLGETRTWPWGNSGLGAAIGSPLRAQRNESAGRLGVTVVVGTREVSATPCAL